MIDIVFIKRNWAVKKRENTYTGQPYQCLLPRLDPGSGALWLILKAWLQQLLSEEVCLSACEGCTIKGWVVTHRVRMGFETMARNRTLNSPLPCIICCCMLLNFFFLILWKSMYFLVAWLGTRSLMQKMGKCLPNSLRKFCSVQVDILL